MFLINKRFERPVCFKKMKIILNSSVENEERVIRYCVRSNCKKAEVHHRGDLSIFYITYDIRDCCYFPDSTKDFRIIQVYRRNQ